MSKNTIYFDTIEQANRYFPDGVPSNFIAIVGDGSQVLVSSDNATNGNQQYFSTNMTNDEIINQMVQDSYDEGVTDGYADGYTDGLAEGGSSYPNEVTITVETDYCSYVTYGEGTYSNNSIVTAQVNVSVSDMCTCTVYDADTDTVLGQAEYKLFSGSADSYWHYANVMWTYSFVCNSSKNLKFLFDYDNNETPSE